MADDRRKGVRIDQQAYRRLPVAVQYGREFAVAVNEIQVLEGLNEGDTVILSDMSRWDNVDRIRLE